ncbi:MAG: acyl carrier protein [Proteobacteria bacterium]|nr:acyl carrier protein [Pseudomonadota bacterium]
MEKIDANKVVLEAVASLAAEGVTLERNSTLLGDGSVLDSMKLVELCLLLEDKASQLGFQFDWTSDSAMSRSRSMFRTVGSLADEFESQMKGQQ